MKFDIIEETKLKTKLTVRCKINLKEYADEEDIKITSKDVMLFLSDTYNISSVLKDDEMWNTPRGNKKNHGTWIFRLKQKIIKKDAPKEQIQEKKEKNFRQRFKSLAKK